MVRHELRAGRAVEAEREQVGVLERRRERLDASGPASIVPIGSIVPETMTGSADAGLVEDAPDAERARP